MGGADYKSIAPEKSYIDVNEFNSVKQLAQFLIKLSKNKVKLHCLVLIFNIKLFLITEGI